MSSSFLHVCIILSMFMVYAGTGCIFGSLLMYKMWTCNNNNNIWVMLFTFVGSDEVMDLTYAAASNEPRSVAAQRKPGEAVTSFFMSFTGFSLQETDLKTLLRSCVPEVISVLFYVCVGDNEL